MNDTTSIQLIIAITVLTIALLTYFIIFTKRQIKQLSKLEDFVGLIKRNPEQKQAYDLDLEEIIDIPYIERTETILSNKNKIIGAIDRNTSITLVEGIYAIKFFVSKKSVLRVKRTGRTITVDYNNKHVGRIHKSTVYDKEGNKIGSCGRVLSALLQRNKDITTITINNSVMRINIAEKKLFQDITHPETPEFIEYNDCKDKNAKLLVLGYALSMLK